MDPVFLSLDEILEIHAQQIERYGGASGLRDAAGLESAVATPQATSSFGAFSVNFPTWKDSVDQHRSTLKSHEHPQAADPDFARRPAID
jgi:hypothetical protein